MILVVLLSLMLHGRMRRTGVTMRFLFYLPGALAGVSSVLLWLILLEPAGQPDQVGCSMVRLGTLAQVIAPGNLPVLFTVIAFWTGAGGWIVVMHGALNNISLRDHRGGDDRRRQTSSSWPVYIEIPMLRKWIAYMLILAFAAGTQLFVEPRWSPRSPGG